jgi:hypothetical protein
MLSTCAAGVVVVNIDNGFGAGFSAARINALRTEGRETAGESDEVRDACA